jgi:gamma-glutamyl:cysteine ligase YbdK (ATP-grasp superfamily)
VYGVVAPLMLALSASTPIMKGQFTDTDVRWNTISDSTNSNVNLSKVKGDYDNDKEYRTSKNED